MPTPKYQGLDCCCSINITIAPNQVVNILTVSSEEPNDRLTQAKMRLSTFPQLGVPKVTQAADNAPIVVKGGPVEMWFRFVDANIRPIGIAFKSTLANMPENAARANHNMPYREVSLRPADDPTVGYPTPGSNATIRVVNYCERTPPDTTSQKYRWEYYLLFQTSDGAIGMIDPEVENDY